MTASDHTTFIAACAQGAILMILAAPALAEIAEADRDLAADLLIDRLRDQDPARLGERLQARGQIDALLRDGYRGGISLETHWPGPGGWRASEAGVAAARRSPACGRGALTTKPTSKPSARGPSLIIASITGSLRMRRRPSRWPSKR